MYVHMMMIVLVLTFDSQVKVYLTTDSESGKETTCINDSGSTYMNSAFESAHAYISLPHG